MTRHKITLDTENIKSLGDEGLLEAHKEYNEVYPKLKFFDKNISDEELISLYNRVVETQKILKGYVLTPKIY